MANVYNTTTSHAEFIPEVWAGNVILAAGDHTHNGFMVNAVNATQVGGDTAYPGQGDILHFPIQSAVTLSNITEGTAH